MAADVLTADTGVFTVTGNAAGMRLDAKTVAAVGAFVEAGIAAGFGSSPVLNVATVLQDTTEAGTLVNPTLILTPNQRELQVTIDRAKNLSPPYLLPRPSHTGGFSV